jgi:hypothetical protein
LDRSAINGGRDTNDSFIFAATIQIGGKKGVTDIEQILTAAFFIIHAYSMNSKNLTIITHNRRKMVLFIHEFNCMV